MLFLADGVRWCPSAADFKMHEKSIDPFECLLVFTRFKLVIADESDSIGVGQKTRKLGGSLQLRERAHVDYVYSGIFPLFNSVIHIACRRVLGDLGDRLRLGAGLRTYGNRVLPGFVGLEPGHFFQLTVKPGKRLEHVFYLCLFVAKFLDLLFSAARFFGILFNDLQMHAAVKLSRFPHQAECLDEIPFLKGLFGIVQAIGILHPPDENIKIIHFLNDGSRRS